VARSAIQGSSAGSSWTRTSRTHKWGGWLRTPGSSSWTARWNTRRVRARQRLSLRRRTLSGCFWRRKRSTSRGCATTSSNWSPTWCWRRKDWAVRTSLLSALWLRFLSIFNFFYFFVFFFWNFFIFLFFFFFVFFFFLGGLSRSEKKEGFIW